MKDVQTNQLSDAIEGMFIVKFEREAEDRIMGWVFKTVDNKWTHAMRVMRSTKEHPELASLQFCERMKKQWGSSVWNIEINICDEYIEFKRNYENAENKA